MPDELKRDLAEAMRADEPKSDLVKRQSPYPFKMIFESTPQSKNEIQPTPDTGEKE